MRIEWIGDDKDQAFVTRGWFFRRTAHLQITPSKIAPNLRTSPEPQPSEYSKDNSCWTYVETGRECAFSWAMFEARTCALNQAKTELEWVRTRSKSPRRLRRILRLLPQVKALK